MKIRFENAPTAAEQSRGMHVDYVAAKRNIPAWRWNMIVLLLVSPALYLLGKALLDQIWITAPGMVEMKEVTLRAEQAGRLAAILPEGSRVAAGTTLASLFPTPAATATATAAAAPGPAEPPKAEPRRQDLPGAALLAYRRDRARRYRQLWQQGAATQAEMAGALAQLAEAEAAYRPLRAVAEPPRPRPEKVEKRVEEVRIAAPYAGIVAKVAGSPGQWLSAGSEVVTLVDDSAASIVAYLDPRHGRYAEPGRPARLKFPDGTRLPARVQQVRVKTARMPSGQGEPLRSGADALQLVLSPEGELPQRYRRQGLPLEVYFDFDFGWLKFGRP